MCPSGELILCRVCGSHCFTETGNSQFIYSYSGGTTRHQYLSVSVHHCSPFVGTTSQSECMTISRGNLIITSMNCSQNFNYQMSAFSIDSIASSNVNFSSFIYNGATLRHCLYSNHAYSQFTISFSNIIQNTSPSTSASGIISIDGHFLIINSTILQNNGILFHRRSVSYNFQVYNSYVVHFSGYPISYTSPISFQSTTSTMTNTFLISHYYTHHCLDDSKIGLDLSPCQTIPPIPTVPPTIPQSPSNCFQSSENNSIILWNIMASIISSLISVILT